MSKLNKYLQKGGFSPPTVIVEKGEYVQEIDGSVFKVSDKMPTHDDTTIVGKNSDKKVKPGKGGVELENISKVVSSTTENRPQKAKSHTEVDQSIKFQKKEAKDFILDNFGVQAKVNRSVSPAGVIDATIEGRDSFSKKFGNIKYRQDTSYGKNSFNANKASLESLPELEEIFDVVFNQQENKKIGNTNLELNQSGGKVKGVLQPPNKDLITTARINNNLSVPISSIDGIVPDRTDAWLAPDSVYLDRNLNGSYNARRFYDSKLGKYIGESRVQPPNKSSKSFFKFK